MFGITPFERNDLWHPFRELENELFKGFGTISHCRTDIRDEGTQYVLECEMPGFDKNDIQIDIHGNTLMICASRRASDSEQNRSGEYIRRERSFGSYCRSFDLTGIDENAIHAAYQNGILTLTLPKMEQQQPTAKRIAIESFLGG